MSSKKLNKQYKKKDLEVVSLSNLIPLKIPEKVQKQIRYLCSKIYEVEWSGILMYSVKGTIEEFDKLEIRIEDIYPMDKGSKTYTEYEPDEDFIGYRMKNPENLKWKMGHIHSHNTMNTFFSGTDMSELNDNSEFHNYYLSLIVNNFGEMTAKVAFRGNVNGFTCKNEKGKDWTLNLTKDRQVLFTFDCDIELETKVEPVEETFSDRVTAIIKEAKRKEDAKKKTSVQKPFVQQPFPGSTKRDYPFHLEETNKIPKQVDKIEDFTRFVLRLGNEDVIMDSFETALEDLEVGKIPSQQFSDSVMENYPALYEKYFDDFGAGNMEAFVDITEEVILQLEEWMDIYDFIEPMTTKLRMMLNRVEATV